MGIPWVLEVISNGIEYSEGSAKSVTVRIILDIFNLLTGIVIFGVLVCKLSVWDKLKSMLWKTSDSYTVITMTNVRTDYGD